MRQLGCNRRYGLPLEAIRSALIRPARPDTEIADICSMNIEVPLHLGSRAARTEFDRSHQKREPVTACFGPDPA